MFRFVGFGLLLVITMIHSTRAEDAVVENVVFAIHGGIGLDKVEMTPEIDKRVRAELEQALRAGFAALNKPNATGLDAVEAAIRLMEDSPQFNAGRGAVFTHDGRNELDASIMEGKTLKAGSVAGVTNVKNPITAARAVMEKSKHVLLVSRGAEAFAAEKGLEIVDPKYFWTEERWKQLQKQLEEEKKRSEVRGHKKFQSDICPASRLAQLARSHSTRLVTCRPGHRPVGCRTSVGGGSETRRSSERERMPITKLVRSPRPVTASTSSATASRTTSSQ